VKKGQPNAWQGSTQWRMISREAIKKWNAKRGSMPKCGAKRKRDGQLCQQLAGENGRCHYHGLRTGKGAKFHVHILPNGDAPNFGAKLQRKLKQIERDRKAQAKRRSRMTPQELAAHEQWHRTHQSGPAAERARRRDERKRAAEIRTSLEKPDDRPISPELAAVQAQVAALEEARDYFRQLAEQEQANQDRGVFG
jgi:hypothetical protein